MRSPSPPLASLQTQAVAPSATFMGIPFVSEIATLDIAVAGVPWDGGTRVRVGARLAPREIRAMSERLHGRHPVFGVSPFDLCTIGDVGDVKTMPFDQEGSLVAIEAFFRGLAAKKVAPVTVGGDHLVTLPILRALKQDPPLALIQFDAHCDTADVSADGDRFASSTPFRRAVEEGLIDPGRTVQIGIRGTLRTYEKMQWALDHGIRQITIDEMYEIGVDAVVREARTIIGDRATYVTIDIDGIDPAFAPGTGTPVVGGITSYEAQRILRGLRGKKVVGGDVVEISPPYDVQNMTSLLGASLVHEILSLVALTRSDEEAGGVADVSISL